MVACYQVALCSSRVEDRSLADGLVDGGHGRAERPARFALCEGLQETCPAPCPRVRAPPTTKYMRPEKLFEHAQWPSLEVGHTRDSRDRALRTHTDTPNTRQKKKTRPRTHAITPCRVPLLPVMSCTGRCCDWVSMGCCALQVSPHAGTDVGVCRLRRGGCVERGGRSHLRRCRGASRRAREAGSPHGGRLTPQGRLCGEEETQQSRSSRGGAVALRGGSMPG